MANSNLLRRTRLSKLQQLIPQPDRGSRHTREYCANLGSIGKEWLQLIYGKGESIKVWVEKMINVLELGRARPASCQRWQLKLLTGPTAYWQWQCSAVALGWQQCKATVMNVIRCFFSFCHPGCFLPWCLGANSIYLPLFLVFLYPCHQCR